MATVLSLNSEICVGLEAFFRKGSKPVIPISQDFFEVFKKMFLRSLFRSKIHVIIESTSAVFFKAFFPLQISIFPQELQCWHNFWQRSFHDFFRKICEKLLNLFLFKKLCLLSTNNSKRFLFRDKFEPFLGTFSVFWQQQNRMKISVFVPWPVK